MIEGGGGGGVKDKGGTTNIKSDSCRQHLLGVYQEKGREDFVYKLFGTVFCTVN